MKSEIKILMIDDDEEDFILAKDLIKKIDHHKYTINWAQSYKEGLKEIAEKNHDVYLVDYRLGVDSGLKLVCEAIKIGCDKPLILLTGQNDVEIDKQAIKEGASDYLVKGTITANQLESSIRHSIAQMKNLNEIKHLNANLEKKVKERTLELTHALEREKTNSEMKSRFVSFASHEFRTPLSAILSSASLIEKYADSEQQENRIKHTNRISDSVKNLTEILNDFLSLAQLDNGVQEIDRSNFNLPDFVVNIIEEMDSIVNKKKQKIIYHHEGQTIVLQPKKIIRNILLNLLSNASKYSLDEKEIHLNTTFADNTIILVIKDQGIGIPESDQTNLFSEFFRASNVENIQGTGLGLSIVKRYVELLDGTINFSSKINVGTTFTVEFPK